MKNEKIREDNLPLVSIITPSYNQGEFIEQTILSVLKQTYPCIEYIVIDGGSSDNTIEILKKYGDNIKWISEKDGGQADAINKGILLSKGDIIGWINSDDVYKEDGIEKLIQSWRFHPDVDMVYGKGIYIDKDGKKIGDYLTEKFSQKELIEKCFICQPSVLFTRRIFERVGALNAAYQLGMDYDLWLRISNAGNIIYVPEYIAMSRMYPENKTMSRKDEAYKEACHAVLEHYGFVPSSWTRGYAFYLSKEKKNIKFYMNAILYFVIYNRKNRKYILNSMLKFFRKG